MPLVIVNRKQRKLDNQTFREVVKNLPAVVAEALTSTDIDGTLCSCDIEVWTRDARVDGLDFPDPLDSDESFDIQVVILVNAYPERVKNIVERRVQISKWLEDNLPQGIRGYVWILPQHNASFGTFLGYKWPTSADVGVQ